MKQIFYPLPLNAGDLVELDEATAHHLFDVLRTESKEDVRLISGQEVYLAHTEQKPYLRIEKKLESAGQSQAAELTLCAALIKADKFEWMLQKAAELGVSRIVPFTCARSIVQIDPKKEAKKQARWNAILEQACRQSNRTTLVHLEPVCSINQLEAYKGEANVCAYEKEDEHHVLYDVLKNPFSSACFVIGPEGGFAPGEAERLEEKGFALCSLGTGILRAETAACFVLSAAQYQLQANAAKDGASAL